MATGHIALLNRILKAGVPLNGSLSFLNDWTYFTSNPQQDFDQLTTTGPHAGTVGAFGAGMRVSTSYGHLIPDDTKTRFWASDSERVIETARYFALKLFGPEWEKAGKATLEIIPESFDRRADTLTPGDTCLKYIRR
ncbi:phosphoglycerate mutase-like protein [Aspergillus ibericus CBS 121593]|uniref:Phosphoglycerate mutase-like protein n=1 Tax=Aspergillus ibericus CBS 121593 TaxID=1448316 RepID=A0A395GN16_9EURO|nr:phosphoglycerate mutase-like protein [Aspergillus ibericus CBS 121593]RAK96742.1 phosphoglycerate mutase-like protein [Aspergillus ibericus CBS 121593]